MRIIPSMLSLLLAAVVGTAVAADAVQEAQFTTQDGTVLTVVSNDDGTITVLNSDGTVLTGAAASQALSAAGITLTVNAGGQIVGVKVAPSVKVTAAPKAATQSTVATVKSAPAAAPAATPAPVAAAPVLPPNVSSSSGGASQSFNTNTGSTVNTKPVSE